MEQDQERTETQRQRPLLDQEIPEMLEEVIFSLG